MFYKKGVLKNFTKLTGKHLYWSLFLLKLQAVGQHWRFPVNFEKILGALILIEHVRTTNSGSCIFYFTFINVISCCGNSTISWIKDSWSKFFSEITGSYKIILTIKVFSLNKTTTFSLFHNFLIKLRLQLSVILCPDCSTRLSIHLLKPLHFLTFFYLDLLFNTIITL